MRSSPTKITCLRVSTAIEVFRKSFRIFPVHQEYYWLAYKLVKPEESIAVIGIISPQE